MRQCPNCGREVPDDAKFCGACGAACPEEVFLTGEPTAPEEPAEQPECPELPVVELPADRPAPSRKKKTKQKSRRRPGCLIWLLSVLLVLSVTAAAGLTLLRRPRSDGAFYLRGNTLCFADAGGRWDRELMPVEPGAVEIDGTGRRIFTCGEQNGSILLQNTPGLPRWEPRQIDSEVTAFSLISDGSRVLYLRGETGVLCLSDGESITEIAENVAQYRAPADFSRVDYLTRDGELVRWTEGEQKPLASHVDRVLGAWATGEISYLRAEETELDPWQFFEDDLAGPDARQEEPGELQLPDAPEEPAEEDFPEPSEYRDAMQAFFEQEQAWMEECDRLEAQYEIMLEEYEEKCFRDGLRSWLKENPPVVNRQLLCLHDGNAETVLTDWCAGELAQAAGDRPVITVPSVDLTKLPKQKLSDFSSVEELAMPDPTALPAELSVAVGTECLPVAEQVRDCCLSRDGSTVAYLTGEPGEGTGLLFTAELSDTAHPVCRSSEAEPGAFFLLEGSNLCTFPRPGELWVNGIRVDDGVRQDSVLLWNNEIFYLKESGVLMGYSGGESRTAAEYVTDFCPSFRNGALLCLSPGKTGGRILCLRQGQTTVLTEQADSLLHRKADPGPMRTGE